MILYPGIDIKEGMCVKVVEGGPNHTMIVNEDPVAQAHAFEDAGFSWLHLVDMDGAFRGRPMNSLIIEKILKSVRVPVQYGGGIRTLDEIETWLEKGALVSRRL